MAGQFCPKCGGQNPVGAAFCQYCGSPMPSAGAPLPAGGPPLPPVPGAGAGPAYQPYAQPASPQPRRRSLGRIVVLVVVVILVIGILAFLLLPYNTPMVNVTEMVFVSSDNTCGLGGAIYDGFSTNTSQPVELEFTLNNSNATQAQCKINTITTNTSGFQIVNVSPLPLVIPANQSEDWTFTVNVPGSAYNGPLYLIVT